MSASEFFGEDVLLTTESAKRIYARVKDLPIIDYHCHLDRKVLASNGGFSDIGELWLKEDHYKWRAMRLCGVEERFIMGDASWREKFLHYAEILPQLAGNPLYYWTHLELRRIFGIEEPLHEKSAERIYAAANKKLKGLTVKNLLKMFQVEYIATTDDPCDEITFFGDGQTVVAPTFRPDKVFDLEDTYLEKLGKVCGFDIGSLADLQRALGMRLDYFVQCGCKIADHGFERFPADYAEKAQAEKLFDRRQSLTAEENDALKGYLLLFLAREYAARDMLMQLHFSVLRNVNPVMFARCGADSGFDIIGEKQQIKDVLAFFSHLGGTRPKIVLYALNSAALKELACLTGAFPNVMIGPAWWFNDSVCGIRENLSVIAEYAALGTNFGMLTDSRSFSSYVRFDFFRRILCDYLGNLVEKGEYDEFSAVSVAENISYYNIKRALQI